MLTREAGAGVRAPDGAQAGARVSPYPLAVLVLVYAIDNADRYVLSSLFPLVKEDFHLSDAQLGSLSAAFMVVLAIAAVPFGVLVDRHTRTRIVAWGTATWSGAMVLAGLAGSYPALFAARMFLGTAEASYTPASFSLISDYYPPERRGRALGIFAVGGTAGFLLLPLGGLVGEEWGWRAAFHVFAIPGFVLAVLAWHLREPARGAFDVRPAGGTAAPEDRTPTVRAMAQLLHIPTVTVTLVAESISTFFLAGLGIWAATFMVRYHDMTIATASSSLALLAVGGILGSLGGGILGDRLVARGAVTGRITVAAAAKAGSVVLLVPAFAVRSTPLMLVLFLLGAAALTAPGPVLKAVRADVVVPALRGRSESLSAILRGGAAGLSPLLFGVLSDAAGLRTALLMLLPTMGLGALLLAALGSRHLVADQQRMQQALETGVQA